jgi:hypothetical protein
LATASESTISGRPSRPGRRRAARRPVFAARGFGDQLGHREPLRRRPAELLRVVEREALELVLLADRAVQVEQHQPGLGVLGAAAAGRVSADSDCSHSSKSALAKAITASSSSGSCATSLTSTREGCAKSDELTSRFSGDSGDMPGLITAAECDGGKPAPPRPPRWLGAPVSITRPPSRGTPSVAGPLFGGSRRVPSGLGCVRAV